MSCVIKSSVGGADGEDVSLGSPGGSELRCQGRSAAAPPRQPGGWTALLLSRLLAPTLSPGLPESTPSSQKRQRDKESDSSGLASAALLRDVQPRGLRDLQGGEHLCTCGVDPNGVVQQLLREPTFHGGCKSLGDLTGLRSKDVKSYHPIMSNLLQIIFA